MSDSEIPRIIFLVYDSRSGSTLLAKELTNNLDGILITPEIGFDLLISAGEKKLRKKGWRWYIDRMYKNGDFRNITMTPLEVMGTLGENQGLLMRDGIELIMLGWAKKIVGENNKLPKCVVIKNGSHIKSWRKIHQLFKQDARFIHIYRDPRAVISSKLKTKRPYNSGEAMAWGGVLLAAWRWRQYIVAAQNIAEDEISILQISYEEFLKDSNAVIEKARSYLGCRRKHGVDVESYNIPDAEIGIHALVVNDGIMQGRANAWKDELSAVDQKIIEVVCGKLMLANDYKLEHRLGTVRSSWLILSAIPATLVKVSRHFYHHYV